MTNSSINRLTTLSSVVFLLVLALAGSVLAQADASRNPKITSRSVHVMATGAVVPSAGSTLFRTKAGVYFDFHTSSLTPGDAVTAWLAVFNNPEFCATEICTPADFANPDVDGTLLNTGGVIVGLDGKAIYGAFRAVGDVTGARPNFGTGNGLVNPMSAQIHIVTRTHGPANLMDAAALQLQLTTFNGGCPPNTCTSIQASVHQ